MRSPNTLSAKTWLDTWEAAARLAPGWREAELLSAASGEARDVVAGLPLGVRDRLLLELREVLFGHAMHCTAECPECGERCEWDCAVEELIARGADGPCDSVTEWCAGEWRVRFRPASGLDLAALSGLEENAAILRLTERCVVDARLGEAKVVVAEWPAFVMDGVASAMAEADPLAAIAVSLACPTCGYAWDASFDIAAFLWAELDAWAERALDDVHRLARQYGWTEHEILTLSAARRARYLARIDS